jgi:uncharacterized protein YuzE
MTAEPKARYDVRADVPYLFCEEGEIARSVKVSPGVTIEFGEEHPCSQVELWHAGDVGLCGLMHLSLHCSWSYQLEPFSLLP